MADLVLKKLDPKKAVVQLGGALMQRYLRYEIINA
jgi:hypothetical protein